MTDKGIIRKLDSTGDTLLAEWDLTELSLEKANAIFNQMIQEGNLLVRADKGTDLRGVKLTKFDPLADEIQVFGQFAGG